MSKKDSKWVKQIRGLASNSSDNDYLKIDYIDVNLNNSRKLIMNLNQLNETNNQQVLKNHEVNEKMIKLQNVHQQMSWLDKLEKK
ncbi:hypothetical protein CLIB1444_01S06238 [[Candida] jaroonii]|uniref:Uncharacterized protein n=1 Tax=[Candida] jaroonii TaxID=467808 RepID=A0ACA9Y0S2_9ASCO|nr:hypothetical protein CLIB1444_01S06238 [[Candida] jaroonii]